MPRAPVWQIKEPVPINQEVVERRKEAWENKFEKSKEKIEAHKKTVQDPMAAFVNLKKKGQILFKYNAFKGTKDDEKIPEGVIALREEKKKAKNVGPQHYFLKKPTNWHKKKKKVDEINPIEVVVDDNGKKTWFNDRDVTEKKIYKPLKGHLF